MPSALRLTSRLTRQPATAGAVPRPARTARLTCSSAMHHGIRAGMKVSRASSLPRGATKGSSLVPLRQGSHCPALEAPCPFPDPTSYVSAEARDTPLESASLNML